MRAGDDIMCAGPGADDLRRGSGDERMSGQNGNDDVRGGTGFDTGHGGAGISNTCDADTEVQTKC